MSRLQVLFLVGLASLLVASGLRHYFNSAKVPRRFDPEDVSMLPGKPVLVEFSTPYCYECKEVLPLLEKASRIFGTPLAVIDAKSRPDLASKYSIRSVPTILVVDAKGQVQRGWLSSPSQAELMSALRSAC